MEQFSHTSSRLAHTEAISCLLSANSIIIATLKYGTPKHLSFAITFFDVASFSQNEMFLYRYLPPPPSLQAVAISHKIDSLRPPIYQFISLWTNRRMKQSFTAR
jgi:hypothetical protein